jgi:hypothetical protein
MQPPIAIVVVPVITIMKDGTVSLVAMSVTITIFCDVTPSGPVGII